MKRSMTVALMITAAVLSMLVTAGCSVSSEEVFSKYTNSESKFIDINGTRVHYRDEGRGPVLLCMHGIMSSLHTWDGWVDRLKDDYRIIRLDLPGWALSGPSSFEYSAEGYVEFLKRFLDELDVQKVHIVGNSFGGFLAWNFTLAHPDRVNSMTLIDAAGYPFKPPLPVTLMTAPVISYFSTIITPRFIVAHNVKDVFGDTGKVTDEIIDRYYDLMMYGDNRKEIVTILKEVKKNIHIEPEGIDTIKHPTLIMWGGADDWIPLDVMERFREDLPHADAVIYDGAGHIPMEEIPEQTAEDIDRFLRGI